MAVNTRRNRVRIEDARRDLKRLRVEIGSWLKEWRARDTLEQYHTQLNVLERVLSDSLDTLDARLGGVAESDPTGTVYAQCRAFEERAVWVRRVWEYYRAKFDQRLNPFLATALRAADELIWSCYREPFRNRPAGADDVAPSSTPLPFVDNAYSPNMIARGEPPRELLSVDDPQLRKFIQQLPIPLVGIPPRSTDAPWWLVFIAHEAGHHVQYDVRGSVLVGDFAQALKDIAAGGDAGERWQFWGQEVFADVYSVSLMGQWALWALCDLEMQADNAMLTARPQYPAPLVRLHLLAAVADALGAPGAATLAARGTSSGASPSVQATPANTGPGIATDMQIAKRIAPALATWQWDDLGSWRALCDWRAGDYLPGGLVGDWARALRGEGVAPTVNPELRDVRLVLCGAMQAWSQIAEVEDTAQRTEARESLANQTFAEIQRCREQGQRPADTSAVPQVEGKGQELAEIVMQISPA